MSWLGLDLIGIWLLRNLFKLLVKITVLPKDLAKLDIDFDKPICYVMQHQSAADIAVLESQCQKQQWNRPLQSIPHELFKENRSYFALNRTDSNGLTQRKTSKPDRLNHLVEVIEKNQELDVQIIPVSVYWGRSPDKENSFWKALFSDSWAAPNSIRKLFMILIHGRQTFIQFSPPVSLRELVDEGLDHHRTVRKLSRVLRVHFRRQREALIGPDLSHRRTLVNSLLQQKNIADAIAQEAKGKNGSQKKAEKTAREYAYEIAADYSHSVVQAFRVALTWLWNRLYDGVDVYHNDQLQALAQDHEIVFVPCHRSHIDYLLLSYVVYFEGLVPPHIAAGVNLNLPVVGPLLRRGGAFFLRRSFNKNRLYSAIFNEYLHTMLSKGFSIEYFVEGGRSRTGRTLQPRTGMLSMTVKSYLRNPHRPIAFLPVFFGYEKVFEASSYVGEMRGKEKKKESLFDLLKSARKLKRKFGKVHVNFGSPIFINEVLNHHQPDWRKETYTQDFKAPWLSETVNDLAHEVVTQINNAVVLNPINLLAMVLLNTAKHAMDESALLDQLACYLKLMAQAPYSDSMAVAAMSAEEIIAYAENMQILQRQPHKLGDILYLNDQEAVNLTFFRNNILHAFVLPSLIANFVINDDKLSIVRIKRFCQLTYPFLKNELFLRWEESELSDELDKLLDTMLQLKLLTTASENSDVVCKPDPHSRAYYQLSVLANALKQTIERYYITAAVLQAHGSGTLSQKALEDSCHLMAQRISMLHGFNAPEFFDKSQFRTIIQMLKEMDYLKLDENGNLTYDRLLEAFVKESHRVLDQGKRLSIEQVAKSSGNDAKDDSDQKQTEVA